MGKLSHAFAVPAYGYSPHLHDCIKSLQAQTRASEIIVSTSTPNPDTQSICDKMGVRLVIHSPNRGIGNDWNHALRSTKATLVTIAHQDDIYYPNFTEYTLDAMQAADDALISFTDYDEVTDNGPRPSNHLLGIKQFLLRAAFLGRSAIRDEFSKKNALRFACPIPCPTVTIDVSRFNLGFDENFRINLDWATWLRASEFNGSFVWIRERLMGHRIHEQSETTAAISDGRRAQEDMAILTKLWPSILAKAIAKSYVLAYRSNRD